MGCVFLNQLQKLLVKLLRLLHLAHSLVDLLDLAFDLGFIRFLTKFTGGLEFSCWKFLKMSHLMSHLKMENSLDSKLQIYFFLSSIRTRSRQ